MPYCFSRSYVKFQGQTALKIVEFDPNWAFPDCNSSLNSPMAMKCCTKLETAKERCPIVFQGHPSNFKVTRDKTSPILTQIGRFRTIGRSQLSNPSDLPCYPYWYIQGSNFFCKYYFQILLYDWYIFVSHHLNHCWLRSLMHKFKGEISVSDKTSFGFKEKHIFSVLAPIALNRETRALLYKRG